MLTLARGALARRSTDTGLDKARAAAAAAGRAHSHAVEVTYVQIYLDQHLQDLLHPASDHLTLRRDAAAGFDRVEGLSAHRAASVSEVLARLLE